MYLLVCIHFLCSGIEFGMLALGLGTSFTLYSLLTVLGLISVLDGGRWRPGISFSYVAEFSTRLHSCFTIFVTVYDDCVVFNMFYFPLPLFLPPYVDGLIVNMFTITPTLHSVTLLSTIISAIRRLHIDPSVCNCFGAYIGPCLQHRPYTPKALSCHPYTRSDMQLLKLQQSHVLHLYPSTQILAA